MNKSSTSWQSRRSRPTGSTCCRTFPGRSTRRCIPGTGQPVGPEDLAPLFPMDVIMQEVSADREIEIPEQVRDVYRLWRPSPLYRARRLERALDTPAHIYYKYEGVSPAGSHKPNTAIAQAYYNQKEGVKKLVTETGAGQWGSALAFAGAHFGLEFNVFMVRACFEQKPYRKHDGKLGSEGAPQPEETHRAETQAGQEDDRAAWASPSARRWRWRQPPGTKYALGSVLNHVLMHQTVIGLEAPGSWRWPRAMPDIIIGCHGGGSNFAGHLPSVHGRQDEREKGTSEFVASEPLACPSLSGVSTPTISETRELIPLAKMYTLGHGFIPPAVHAGGLRYHGARPIISLLVDEGLIRARGAATERDVRGGGALRPHRGIIPRPSPRTPLRSAIRAARSARKPGRRK